MQGGLFLFVDGKERIESGLAKFARVIEPAVAVQCRNGLHLFRGQLKVEDG